MDICTACDIAYIGDYKNRRGCPIFNAKEEIETLEKTIEDLNKEISDHECGVA